MWVKSQGKDPGKSKTCEEQAANPVLEQNRQSYRNTFQGDFPSGSGTLSICCLWAQQATLSLWPLSHP